MTKPTKAPMNKRKTSRSGGSKKREIPCPNNLPAHKFGESVTRYVCPKCSLT